MSSNTPEHRACGTWPSPITSEMINLTVTTIEDVFVDPITTIIYHIENRPFQKGRSVIVESHTGTEIVSAPYDAKTLVNHYGRAAAAVRNNLLYFSNVVDNRVYRMSLPNSKVFSASPAQPSWRFAHFAIHPTQSHLVVCIMEDHTDPLPLKVVTTLVCINTLTSTVTTITSGADFYLNPTFSLDGLKLAWTQWNHPYMQWHAAQLFVADVSIISDPDSSNAVSLQVENPKIIAGEPGLNAVYQPEWLLGSDGGADLVFVWDKRGWCEPWIWSPSTNNIPDRVIRQENPVEADFAGPVWWLDDSSCAILNAERLSIWTTVTQGLSKLSMLDLQTGTLKPIQSPYVDIGRLRRVNECTVVFIGVTALRGPSLVKMTIDTSVADIATTAQFEILFSTEGALPGDWLISCAESFKVKKSNNEFTYANFYRPANSKYQPLPDEKPPCILSLHSGPTYRSSSGFTWYRQFYTSRGFAWLDVEYSGSSGYGREYRKRLDGQYGVLDVEDVLEATEYLAGCGLFDRDRVALRSSSGGSFPELQAFTNHPQSFAAAAAHFIIADPALFAYGTDKLTSHYMSGLMGGTPEEIPDVYRERSPILHADRIVRPLMITHSRKRPTFDQAEKLVDAIKAKGGRVEYIVFETVPDPTVFKLLYDKELAFFQDVLSTHGGTKG